MFTYILWALALLQFSYIRPPAHTPVSILTIPHSALIRNRTEEKEKDGESGALSRRNPDRINYNNDSKLANITEKWDVPGSPSKPEQTGVTSKIKPIFKNRNENLTFFMRIFEKINVGWKNALKINQHFNLAYIPSPRVNHYNSGTVANSIQAKSSYKMVDFLSLPKILPSFNIGVILALIQCFLIKYGGKRRCYSTGKEVQSLKRGSTLLFMFSCIKCVAYKILFYKKGKSTKRRISVYPPTNVSAVGRPNVSPKIKKSCRHFHDYSQLYDLRQFFESCTTSTSSHTGVSELEVTEERLEELYDESEEDYNVYDHLDTVPIKMPTPLSWQDYMYTPTQISVHGMENKGPLRPIDQKPNMRGDPDYDDLSPNQQAKRDLDQFYEYQAKVLAETSARTPKKIKTRVWTATKSSKPSKVDFTSELKQVTRQHREKTRATYTSPDSVTQENYVKPEQKRDQEPSLQLTPKRKNIVYQEGETVEEMHQKTNNTSPIPPARGSSCSLSLTQSSASPVDNLLAKFQKATWVTEAPSPPLLSALPPPVSLPNHDANSPFKPISSRGSSPKTSTPILTPNQDQVLFLP